MARTNFTLPDTLNKRVDEEAKRLCISKASVINLALNQYFEQRIITEKLWDSFTSLTQNMKKVKSMVIEGGSFNAKANLLPSIESTD